MSGKIVSEAERLERLEELRGKALLQSEEEAKKQRWDLFSQAPPLGLGDADYKKKHNRREAPRKVRTEPRGIFTNPPSTGQSPVTYFDGSVYLEGDKYSEPYVDPSKLHKHSKNQPKDAKDKKKDDRPSFFPAVTKWAKYEDPSQPDDKRFGAPYKYIEDPGRYKRIQKKGANGRVIVETGPRNIQSVPIRHGKYNSTYGHTINPYPEFKSDDNPEDRKKKIEERNKWNHLYKEKRNGPFKSKCHPKTIINSDRNVFGIDGLPEQPVVNEKKVIKKGVTNEREPFKPSNPVKKGALGTIGKFPNSWVDKNQIPVKNIGGEKKKDDRPAFKPSRSYLSRPTPSITLLASNIRSYI